MLPAVETPASCDDNLGDAARVGPQIQAGDGPCGEPRRVLLVEPHARGEGRKVAAGVEAPRVDRGTSGCCRSS